MRNKFADMIYKMGKKDRSICALVADISPAGSMQLFREEFPERFINTGVAEQSMIGLAAGLAMDGMRPFCYTIAPFALYRPFEMIRVDLAYQNLPVTVIGMGAGLIYSTLGSTHQSIEDIAVASAVPNMTVLAPCDPHEMEMATEWCATADHGPVYMRLGKAGEPSLTHNALDEFEVGRPRLIKHGDDVLIMSYGTIVANALKAADILATEDIHASVLNVHTLKPFPENDVCELLSHYQRIVIYEEHVPFGGLADRVTRLVVERNLSVQLNVLSIKDEFVHFYGSYERLLEQHGLSVEHLCSAVRSMVTAS